MFALVFLLPIHLQLGHGANASDAGLQMLPLTVGLVVGSTINGRITARTAMPSRRSQQRERTRRRMKQ